MGDNVVKVKVTAEDGNATQTYTVTVTRALPSIVRAYIDNNNFLVRWKDNHPDGCTNDNYKVYVKSVVSSSWGEYLSDVNNNYTPTNSALVVPSGWGSRDFTFSSGIFFSFDVEVWCGARNSGRKLGEATAPTLFGRTSNVELSGATLTPGFNTYILDYDASVPADATSTTVTASVPSGASVSYLDSTGSALSDADGSTAGFQVDLGADETVFSVKISRFRHGTSTYTFTVTRQLPTLSIDDASAAEGSDLVFTVNLNAASTEMVTVDYATSVESTDTATEDTDYTAASGSLTFNAGETTKTITVQTTADSVADAGETFTVTLSNASSNVTISDAAATGTITAPAPSNAAPSFTSGAAFSVVENTTEVGTVEAEDTDTGDTITGYSINATTGGADRAQFEIDAGTGALTFVAAPDFENPADVDSTNPVNEPMNNEYIVEVTAASGAGDRAMTAVQTITVTVTNEDPPATMVTLTVPADPVHESVGTFNVTVTATTERDEEFRTGYTFGPTLSTRSETAAGGSDYSGLSQQVVFTQTDFTRGGTPPVWSATKTVAVTVIDDTDEEPAETFKLILERGPGLDRAISVDTDARVVTIAKNDVPPTEVAADWALIPSGLNVGDEFRLLVITSTERRADSTTIAHYDTHVQNAVKAGHTAIRSHSSLFQVVGCTAAVDARDHTYTTHTATAPGVAIYWLDGNKAADDYGDFYDGDWDEEATGKNESGTDVSFPVNLSEHPFTGCDHDGTEEFSGSTSRALGATLVRQGDPNGGGSAIGPIDGNRTNGTTVTGPFYGLSPVFRVVAANNPPSFTSDATFSVVENTTEVGTVEAEDTDTGDAITGYSINATTGGADRAKFEITDEGVLTFVAAPDFEAPTDVLSTNPSNQPGNNEYVVEVTATSGAGDRAMTATQTITVTVTNEDPPPAPVTTDEEIHTFTSLSPTWNELADTASVTGYDLQYRPTSPANSPWTTLTDVATTAVPASGSLPARRQATITGLLPSSSYDVQARAKSVEGEGAWSANFGGGPGFETQENEVYFDAASYDVVEGGSVEVTVRLAVAHGRATGNFDLGTLIELTLPSPFSFGPTETEKTVTVAGDEDALVETEETFVLMFHPLLLPPGHNFRLSGPDQGDGQGRGDDHPAGADRDRGERDRRRLHGGAEPPADGERDGDDQRAFRDGRAGERGGVGPDAHLHDGELRDGADGDGDRGGRRRRDGRRGDAQPRGERVGRHDHGGRCGGDGHGQRRAPAQPLRPDGQRWNAVPHLRRRHAEVRRHRHRPCHRAHYDHRPVGERRHRLLPASRRQDGPGRRRHLDRGPPGGPGRGAQHHQDEGHQDGGHQGDGHPDLHPHRCAAGPIQHGDGHHDVKRRRHTFRRQLGRRRHLLVSHAVPRRNLLQQRVPIVHGVGGVDGELAHVHLYDALTPLCQQGGGLVRAKGHGPPGRGSGYLPLRRHVPFTGP